MTAEKKIIGNNFLYGGALNRGGVLSHPTLYITHLDDLIFLIGYHETYWWSCLDLWKWKFFFANTYFLLWTSDMYVNLNAISFIVTVTMKNYFSRCHVAKKTLCCSSMQLFDVVVTISNTLRRDITLKQPTKWRTC